MIFYILAFLSFFFCLSFYNQPLIGKFMLCSSFLLLMKPILDVKLQRPHWLFLSFIAWVFICCINSDYPSIALFGFHLRMDGFITYMMATILAAAYWMQHKDWKAITFYILAILLIFGNLYILVDDQIFSRIAVTPIVIGAILSTTSVILWALNPWLTLLVLPFIFLSHARSCLIAIPTSILCYQWLKGQKININKYFWIAISSFLMIIPLTTLGEKINRFNLYKAGTGARTQWMLQASDMAYNLPLTGYGLDTLAKYLNRANEEYAQKNAVADKTHCIVYDLILMTGWIGYTIALMILGMALWITLNHRTEQNIICFCVIVGWIIFGMFNPQSMYSTVFAIWAIFGLKESDKKTN